MPEGEYINAGDLRHRVTWQTLNQSTQDATGQPIDVWSPVGTYWSRVEPLSGRELTNAQQVQPTTTHKITMRAVGPIKPSDRLLFEGTGRIFNIDSVFRVDEKNASLSLMATELIRPS